MTTNFPEWKEKEFFHFDIVHTSKKSNARVGKIYTPHGVIDTPNFVAVATNAALKAVDHQITDHMDQQLMFCNTYHLMLQPGPEIVEQAGGLHNFMNRQRPLITDSGGFQVFSLASNAVTDELNRKQGSKYKSSLLKVSEEGVVFKSYRDGSLIELTPESSVGAQKSFGADIIIPLDELPPFHISDDELVKSVNLTHRWEARSLQTHLENVKNQAMYGVIHGGINPKLREMSSKYITSLPFDGFAIGGSLGRNLEELTGILKVVLPLITKTSLPNHLLGVADEPAIRSAIPFGVDTFDSCFPTRLGRHGTLLTTKGRINVRNKKYATMYTCIDEQCSCSVCQNYTLAYIHHLIKAKEPLAGTLMTIHNIHYMIHLMQKFRQYILDDKI